MAAQVDDGATDHGSDASDIVTAVQILQILAVRRTTGPRERARRVPTPKPKAPTLRLGGCACGGGCPRCAEPVANPDKARKADTFADRTLTQAATAGDSAHGGQPLPEAIVRPLRSVFNVDFSAVRVHSDRASAVTSHAHDARAIAYGSDIYFDKGQYRPDTLAGRDLIAHELAHVAGQAQSGARIQRSPYTGIGGEDHDHLHARLAEEYANEVQGPSVGGVQYTEGYRQWLEARSTKNVRFVRPPTIQAHDPLARLQVGQPTGLTTLFINGSSMGATVGAYLSSVQNEITPKGVAFAPGLVTGQVACRFDPTFRIETATVIDEITAAPSGGWRAVLPPASVGAAAVCPGVAKVPVTLLGDPTDQAFQERVHNSEMEHVDALETLHDRHFVPYYHHVMTLSATGGSDATCESALRRRLADREVEAATAFVLGDLAESRRFDDPTSTHQGDLTPVVAPRCASVTLTARQRNPQQPGAGPGNVRTIAPKRTAVDPAHLNVSGTTLMSGSSVVRIFASTADAATAMGVLATFGVTEIQSIGPVEVLLVKGQPAVGALAGIPGRDLDLATYQVGVDPRAINDWLITEMVGQAGFIIANFGAKRDEAYSAVALMRAFSVRRQSWIGPAAAPQMVFYTG
jgi:hypothetical protein